MRRRDSSGVSHGPFRTSLTFIPSLAIATTYLLWSWTDKLVGLGGDNALYMLMARHYSLNAQISDHIAEHFTGISQFPPLYPWTLAMFGVANGFLAAHLLTTGFLILSFALLFVWCQRAGLEQPACSLVVLAFALFRGTYMQTLYLQSENLFLLLTMAFFAIASLPRLSMAHLLALALFAAAATLTRTAGFALLGAFAIYLIICRPPRWATILTLAFAPPIVWNILAYAAGPHYVASLIPAAGGSPLDQLWARVGTQAYALAYGWTDNLTALPVLRPLCLVLGIFCLLGGAVRAAQMHIDGLYVVFYLVLMLFWPFPGESMRFMFVLVPVCLLQGTLLIGHLTTSVMPMKTKGLMSVSIPVASILIALPALVLTFQRLLLPVPQELEHYRRDPSFFSEGPDQAIKSAYTNLAISDALQDVAGAVKSNECILAIKPSLVSLISGRLAKAPPPAALPQEQFNQSIRDLGCGYVLMLNMRSPTFDVPMYPWDRMSDRIKVLKIYNIPATGLPLTIAAIGEIRPRLVRHAVDERSTN